MTTKQLIWTIVLIIISTSVIVACGPVAPEAPAAQADEAEHHEDADHHNEAEQDDSAAHMHMHVDPPHEYAELTNPFSGNDKAVAAGKVIFETHCLACHGEEGKGDGPGAVELDPKPANLGDAAMMNDLSDSYLFWRVSEGGAMEPFNSAMIAWKEVLSEEERWQVVNYVRTFVAIESDGHTEAEHHDDGDEHPADDHEAEEEHHEDDHQTEDDHHEDTEHHEGDGN